MFSQEEIASYKKTKAPKDLKDKILPKVKEQKEKNIFEMKKIKSYLTVAACFVLIAVIGFVYFGNNKVTTGVYFDGDLVGEHAVSLPASRALAHAEDYSVEVSVMLELKTDELCNVRVDGGTMWLDKAQAFTQSCDFDSKLALQWIATATPEENVFTMTVSSKDGELVYTLCYDAGSNGWTISRISSSNNINK